MGAVHVTIDLENTTDADKADEGLIASTAVRRHSVRALVDTGAIRTVTGPAVSHSTFRSSAKLTTLLPRRRMPRWSTTSCGNTSSGNRTGVFECLVGPPTCEPLLGQIPLERLDLLVDRVRQQLVVRPESPIYPLYSVK